MQRQRQPGNGHGAAAAIIIHVVTVNLVHGGGDCGRRRRRDDRRRGHLGNSTNCCPSVRPVIAVRSIIVQTHFGRGRRAPLAGMGSKLWFGEVVTVHTWLRVRRNDFVHRIVFRHELAPSVLDGSLVRYCTLVNFVCAEPCLDRRAQSDVVGNIHHATVLRHFLVQNGAAVGQPRNINILASIRGYVGVSVNPWFLNRYSEVRAITIFGQQSRCGKSLQKVRVPRAHQCIVPKSRR